MKTLHLLTTSCKGGTFLLLLALLLSACAGEVKPTVMESDKKLPAFDWQGHRGCRGILPENTVPAFLKALDYNVKTLEMDAAISKDNKVIISHEPLSLIHISEPTRPY